jgi:hypothetical protein
VHGSQDPARIAADHQKGKRKSAAVTGTRPAVRLNTTKKNGRPSLGEGPKPGGSHGAKNEQAACLQREGKTLRPDAVTGKLGTASSDKTSDKD